jgi:hypothetical protein
VYQILQKLGAHVSMPSIGMEVGDMDDEVVAVSCTHAEEKGGKKKLIVTRPKLQLPLRGAKDRLESLKRAHSTELQQSNPKP